MTLWWGASPAGTDPQLTELEKDILGRFHVAYSDKGFPDISELQVEYREHTGAGRYTYLGHPGVVALPDGWHGVGNYCHFEMDGLPYGGTYGLFIEKQKIKILELSVIGECEWYGSENSWRIADPKTGEFSD
ncbi:hypothetical protein [Methylopila turkensis]|uniref:Uncharacterized protein n=1 Tax=Methylopila turkensis TaxID=1437816 RepID=A0A9W6JMH7_9HYPH|nr:hypothetical protein [Methylopila turkensis]GLK79892.1 hypothetical protein GCM10008174_16330 [Methylopila turkensis]